MNELIENLPNPGALLDTRRIPLTQGYSVLIDEEDFEKVSKIKWHYDHGYAANKGKEKIYMHRFIMGNKNRKEVDHMNHDRLDNRKENLRFASRRENGSNLPLKRNNTSGFRGVSWLKTLGKWEAYINVDYKKIGLGYFNDRIEAAKAYNNVAGKYFGEFAVLNKI